MRYTGFGTRGLSIDDCRLPIEGRKMGLGVRSQKGWDTGHGDCRLRTGKWDTGLGAEEWDIEDCRFEIQESSMPAALGVPPG